MAVAALFFANGALFANIVPRYPQIKAELALSNAQLGSAVAAYALGALIIGFGGGALVHRWGSVRVAPASTVAMAGNLVLLGLVPSWAALAAALFVAGALDALADVGGNAHGLRVERLYGRSILNSLHGVWSVGAVVGGLMGAGAAGLAVPLGWHLAGAALVFGALAAAVRPLLLPGRDDVDAAGLHGPPEQGHPGQGAPEQGRPARRLRLVSSLAALAVIAAGAQVLEDAAATWSAVYLREDLGTTAATAGLGFIALQTLQTVGRLVGDRLVTRYGDRAVARAGALLAGGAMAAALAVPTATSTVLAFGAVGLGIGTLIPASLRTADLLPGLPRGAGLTVVGSGIRLGGLTLPPVIGIAADAWGLRLALGAIPVAAVLVLVLAAALPRPVGRSGAP